MELLKERRQKGAICHRNYAIDCVQCMHLHSIAVTLRRVYRAADVRRSDSLHPGAVCSEEQGHE